MNANIKIYIPGLQISLYNQLTSLFLISGGVKMRYPSTYVLITDLDESTSNLFPNHINNSFSTPMPPLRGYYYFNRLRHFLRIMHSYLHINYFAFSFRLKPWRIISRKSLARIMCSARNE